MKRVVLLTLLVGLLAYMWVSNTREHLTPGPPTLASLQTDTQDLDKRLTTLNKEFQQMKKQASEGANQAAAARAQISAVKNG